MTSLVYSTLNFKLKVGIKDNANGLLCELISLNDIKYIYSFKAVHMCNTHAHF